MAGIYGVGSMAIPFIILPWTLTYVSNTTAAIYFAVIPIEVLLLSRIVLGTPVTKRKWIGFMTASAGSSFSPLPAVRATARRWPRRAF